MVGGVSYRVDSATRRWQWISLAACIIQVPDAVQKYLRNCVPTHIHQTCRLPPSQGIFQQFFMLGPEFFFLTFAGLAVYALGWWRASVPWMFFQAAFMYDQFQHRAWARFIGGRGLEKAFLNIHAPLLLFVLASGLMYFKNAYRQYRVAAKGDGEDRSELKPMCHIPSAPDSPA